MRFQFRVNLNFHAGEADCQTVETMTVAMSRITIMSLEFSTMKSNMKAPALRTRHLSFDNRKSTIKKILNRNLTTL